MYFDGKGEGVIVVGEEENEQVQEGVELRLEHHVDCY